MRQRYCVPAIVVLALSGGLCHASGDYGCGAPRGNIFFRGYTTCNSVPFLSPSNDSRLNLDLLLMDAGKLTGTVTMPQEYPVTPDVAYLRVPFDFGNWQVSDPGMSKSAPAGTNSAANSNDYAEGEGSRCTNAKAAAEVFRAAVTGAGLAADETSALITARSSLAAACDVKVDWKTPEGVHSATGREFALYIAGASAFYGGDFVAALKDFESLTKSGNAWLKETSRYMMARTLLNKAQAQAFGEWGALDVKSVSQADLKGAEDGFNAYLHDFPRGTYAGSAEGLLRRVYWLGGDQARLAQAYDRALAENGKAPLADLVQEIDNKLLKAVDVNRIRSTELMAIVDLMRMRSGDEEDGGGSGDNEQQPVLTLKDLEAQKDRFAGNQALYNYLLAAFEIYVDHKPEQALAVLPGAPKAPLGYFAFSQQTLRALAFDATKQFDEERKLLTEMLPLATKPLEPEQVQLQLARLEQHTGHVDQVFAADSPVREPAIRTILVEYSASAPMLRQRIRDAKENAAVAEAAVYTLLFKELTGGKYQDFVADLALMPAHPSEILAPFAAAAESKKGGYACPALREVATTLEHKPDDAASLNCVGELVRLHEVHYGQSAAPPETDLGGSESVFPLTNYSRMDGYLKVIADHGAEREARAYALYRAVHCYAPSGYNDCGKQDIPPGTRKAWFDTLHREYGDSVWAKSLKYYW